MSSFRSFQFLIAFIALLFSCGNEDDHISNSDLPEIIASDLEIAEGNEGEHEVALSFKLSKASSMEVSLRYSTEGLTAKADDDFVSSIGEEVTFVPGDTIENVQLIIVGDNNLELKEEIRLVITEVENASFDGIHPVVAIKNDDSFTPVEDEEGFITPSDYPGMELIWSDEFDGPNLNPDFWNYDIGDGCPELCGWGNREIQYYTMDEENVFLEDGRLHIRADNRLETSQFISGRINTKGKQEIKFGRIDIRAKLPRTQGIWPAIWMLGSNIDFVGWPASGELDIMELRGQEPDKILGTVHWDDGGHNFLGSEITLERNSTFSDKFHVFTILWEKNSIHWLVDYEEFFNVNPARLKGKYPFNQPFFFIFNVAIGGDFVGSIDASTEFPQTMEIDYVRVFR